ncbi:MAG: hypothetical protein H7246_12585 [Phycisphaerae bacterium]|nr:hypothetical protein [Saprospiraceae bacterium]
MKKAFTVKYKYKVELIYGENDSDAAYLNRRKERDRLSKEIYGNLSLLLVMGTIPATLARIVQNAVIATVVALVAFAVVAARVIIEKVIVVRVVKVSVIIMVQRGVAIRHPLTTSQLLSRQRERYIYRPLLPSLLLH